MEELKSNHKPAPGIAEALHPEIGNGSAFESDKHAFVLRMPDPSVQLASYINQSGEDADETANPEYPGEKILIVQVPSDEDIFPKTIERVVEANVDSEISQQDSSSVAPEEEQIPANKTTKNKKTGKPGKKSVSGQSEDEPEPEVTKPKKPGKLLRKAAKSIKKSEEGQKAPVEEQANQSQLNLSPFTSWLKKLTGSDYVHPYEDDFAFEQGSGASKEGISETFADLLAAQGYKDQAREMYLKLMEKYPEKSGFFAAKIEAL